MSEKYSLNCFCKTCGKSAYKGLDGKVYCKECGEYEELCFCNRSKKNQTDKKKLIPKWISIGNVSNEKHEQWISLEIQTEDYQTILKIDLSHKQFGRLVSGHQVELKENEKF